jgi:hypothetical protein
MRSRRTFRLIEIKKMTVSGCIMAAGSDVVRAGHVKVEHNAKIRTQTAAD